MVAHLDLILSCRDMKQADIAVLRHSIDKISRSSALGPRIRRVDVEAEADAEGDAYLRVSLELDHTDDLEWDYVEPLVCSIEDAVATVDDRFPSVHFADAA
jgi:hypothetical protein